MGITVLYLLYLNFRKPQTAMQQTEALSIEIKPINERNMTSLLGSGYFIDPRLHLLQSLELMSSHPFFGGWSAISVSDNETQFSAVSDTGHWLEAEMPQHDDQISALTAARIGPLRDEQGMTLRNTGYGDIEAISMGKTRTYLGFESYRSGIWSASRQASLENSRFTRARLPPDIEKLPIGRGLEAITLIEDIPQQQPLLLAIAERDNGKSGSSTPAWWLKQDGQVAAKFFIPLSDGYDVSDAAYNVRCGLFVLERKLNFIGRFFIRLVRLEPQYTSLSEPIKQETLFQANSSGAAIDNMEALAVVADQSNGCHLYIMSDSNFLPIQKTIMLKFGYR